MYTLQCGVDVTKDQTYFLTSIQQEALKRTLFPVGHILKSKVLTCLLLD